MGLTLRRKLRERKAITSLQEFETKRVGTKETYLRIFKNDEEEALG